MTRVKNLPPEWLTNRTTVEAVLNRFTDSPLNRATQITDKVTKFAAQMQSGDELWRYSSSSESWANKMGSAGLAIVRNGQIADAMQTIMN
jgi:hypothetical protein